MYVQIPTIVKAVSDKIGFFGCYCCLFIYLSVQIEEVYKIFPESTDSKKSEDADLQGHKVWIRIWQDLRHKRVQMFVQHPPAKLKQVDELDFTKLL